VKLSSPGPVIFRQRRNGLDGEEIVVYKFRSMRSHGRRPGGPQATKDDPRITPFGAFMRRTSLDELPQFVNVLQGRMSIVGPRPHAVAHNEMYRQLIKAYMVRHKVKPGITGWAQVNGLRGETDTVDKMQQRWNTTWNTCATGRCGWTCRSSRAPSSWSSSTATPTEPVATMTRPLLRTHRLAPAAGCGLTLAQPCAGRPVFAEPVARSRASRTCCAWKTARPCPTR
jgi:hypothetical protein